MLVKWTKSRFLTLIEPYGPGVSVDHYNKASSSPIGNIVRQFELTIIRSHLSNLFHSILSFKTLLNALQSNYVKSCQKETEREENSLNPFFPPISQKSFFEFSKFTELNTP
jgi:hypothetical protein